MIWNTAQHRGFTHFIFIGDDWKSKLTEIHRMRETILMSNILDIRIKHIFLIKLKPGAIAN